MSLFAALPVVYDLLIMTVSRIYEGRVIRVELLDGAANPKPLPIDALWLHHELFQDAVNYYMLALAAMAVGAGDATVEASALTAWAGRMRECWVTVKRRADTFAGPRDRLAALLGLRPSASFEEACAVVLSPSRATRTQQAAALKALLEETGDLNKLAVDRLPWLACPPGYVKKASKSVSSAQEAKRGSLIKSVAAAESGEALELLLGMDVGVFYATPPVRVYAGDEAKATARECFRRSSARFPALQSCAEAFNVMLDSATDLQLPRGSKPSGLRPIAVVAKLLPRAETLQAFRDATRSVASGKEVAVVADPVAESRVGDQPAFQFFTNVALTPEEGRPTRARWFELDLAAFIEALKSPRRYLADTKERLQKADEIAQEIGWMMGRGRQQNAEEEIRSFPGFDGDKRMELVRRLVQGELARTVEAAESERQEYQIRPRTLRGYGRLRERWRGAMANGSATEERLRDILAEEQASHRDDFGSAELFAALIRQEFQPIWRDPGTKPWHAGDPLAAWLQYRELKEDELKLRREIRFTPAHAVASPRYFFFPKAGMAHLRHDAEDLSLTAGIVHEGKRAEVRICYSAPRLLRDHARNPAPGEDLAQEPWLQPMMAALGTGPTPVDFAKCAATLRVSRPENAGTASAHLDFPLSVESEDNGWFAQCNPIDLRARRAHSLRWQHEKPPKSAPPPWYAAQAPFWCLAVDLGQRDAGAFARLAVSAHPSAPAGSARFLGDAGGSKWYARPVRVGVLRLPGEDASVWRNRSRLDRAGGPGVALRQEAWGERGRPALAREADEAEALARQLGVEPGGEGSLLAPGWKEALSFPDQNLKLLIALRRYQSGVSRLHRWRWFLADNGRSAKAREEIVQDQLLIGSEQRTWAERSDPRLLSWLDGEIKRRLNIAQAALVAIANRVLPLRTRRWSWCAHPDAGPGRPLYLLEPHSAPRDGGARVLIRGQRGLSQERIEQVSELRVRAQSLNALMRRAPGAAPLARRDDSVPDACPEVLQRLDRLKRERVRQTAHLILAEALGLRLSPPPISRGADERRADRHGSYVKIKGKAGEPLGPVQFVVLENLSRYLTSQSRAPRENSRLMQWCHREVLGKVRELCDTFGIPVLETPAAYSSRFCSRTGVAGFRAADVSAGFTKTGYWAGRASRKHKDGSPTEEARSLQQMDQRLAEISRQLDGEAGGSTPRTFLIPMAGGPIFVPLAAAPNGRITSPPLQQADINAAINLALRALADPRRWEIFPRLRTRRAGKRLVAYEKRRFGDEPVAVRVSGKAGDSQTPNFFADVAGLQNRAPAYLREEWVSAQLDAGTETPPPLLGQKSLWGTVAGLAWEAVGAINEQRARNWIAKHSKAQGAEF